jgi:hypothetical protein
MGQQSVAPALESAEIMVEAMGSVVSWNSHSNSWRVWFQYLQPKSQAVSLCWMWWAEHIQTPSTMSLQYPEHSDVSLTQHRSAHLQKKKFINVSHDISICVMFPLRTANTRFPVVAAWRVCPNDCMSKRTRARPRVSLQSTGRSRTGQTITGDL